MSDSLFKLLLGLFEKTLAQLKEKPVSDSTSVQTDSSPMPADMAATGTKIICLQVEQINAPKQHSIRVFTPCEQMKLTKASYQFLTRMSSWGLVEPETMELIINRLFFSSARIVGLQESKWTVRQALLPRLSVEQLAFLDLVLYQGEDNISLH